MVSLALVPLADPVHGEALIGPAALLAARKAPSQNHHRVEIPRAEHEVEII
jgi:hypothetical protein